MSKPKKISEIMPKEIKENIPETPSGKSKKASSTDWQEDSLGRKFKENELGTRLYTLPTYDSLIPLGQFFKTKIAQKYKSTYIIHFHDEIPELEKKWADMLKQNKKYAVGYIKRFEEIRGEGKGYYLYSRKPGSGKTMLGCCILNGLSGTYEVTTQAITVIDFLKRLKATFNDEDISEESVINPMLAVGVLLLDDCGSEKHTDWVDEQLYHIIDSRLSSGKPTFFTSNYSIDELPYHKRIKSRINAITAQIAMPEKDIRALVNQQQEQEFLNRISK